MASTRGKQLTYFVRWLSQRKPAPNHSGATDGNYMSSQRPKTIDNKTHTTYNSMPRVSVTFTENVGQKRFKLFWQFYNPTRPFLTVDFSDGKNTNADECAPKKKNEPLFPESAVRKSYFF